MKKTGILIITAAVFLLHGCVTENSISPDFSLQENNRISWLEGSPALYKDVLVEQEINGRSGGIVTYDVQVANIYVSGNLTIPRNSYDGTVNISATFSSRTTTQTFGPSPFEFRRPLLLTLEYSGVDLRGINPEQIDFYYLGSSGEFVKAQYSSIEVNPETGTLKVVNAQLNHFSRWGWAKATDE